jgi:hypothetical protein
MAMTPQKRDMLILGTSVTIVFGVCVAIGSQLMPSPMTSTDALVVGTMAALFALGTLFLGLIATIYRGTSPFFRRRSGEEAEEERSSGRRKAT